MTLSTCFRCGGEFLPPYRAPLWRWCHPCSCEGSGVNPWDNPERDWSDWNPLPPEDFYGYADDGPEESDARRRLRWVREVYRWPPTRISGSRSSATSPTRAPRRPTPSP